MIYILLHTIHSLTHSSLDLVGRRGDRMDEEAEVRLQAGRSEERVSSSGVDSLVHSFMLSDQLFLCLPLLRPPSTVPCKMTLERLSWRDTWPYHISFLRLNSATGTRSVRRQRVVHLNTRFWITCICCVRSFFHVIVSMA